MKPKTSLTEEAFNALGDDHLLRDAYEKQKDGTFALTLDSTDGRSLEDVVSLRNALSAERASRKAAEDIAKQFEGLDPQSARDALQRLADLGDDPNGETKRKAALEAQAEQLTRKYQGEIDSKDAAIADLTKQLENHLLTQRALIALGPHVDDPTMLLPHVVNQMRMVKDDAGQFRAAVVGDDGNERITMKAGSTAPMGVEELVLTMKEIPTFQPGFKATNASGAESSSNTGGSSPPPKEGILQIKSSDQNAINANWQKIANGTAVVVD